MKLIESVIILEYTYTSSPWRNQVVVHLKRDAALPSTSRLAQVYVALPYLAGGEREMLVTVHEWLDTNARN